MIFSDFLAGITMATLSASGIFFLKFWKASRDRFFLLFCIACWLLALDRIAAVAVGISRQRPEQTALMEASSWVYLLRLVAYITIIVAVIDRNRTASRN